MLDWMSKMAQAAKESLSGLLPSFRPVESARELISEAVAQKIREEACAKAYALLAQTHRSVVQTVIWQNSALLVSLLPVYCFRSAVPFYLAYAAVASYSAYSVAMCWPLVRSLFQTRSVTKTLAQEVLSAIDEELTQRQFYERKVVEWLGPDLKRIADDVARKLRPDFIAAALNMALTLLLSFVAFRLFALPMLEYKALTH